MMLFEPITINGLTIKNRIFMAPMCTHFDVSTEEGRGYYQKRAEGGVGLIIIEGISVDLFEIPKFKDQIKRLADVIHKEQTRIIIQLSIPAEIPNTNKQMVPSACGTAEEASFADIQLCYQRMANAALACQSAGCDGIEIHGAHGYFMSQFFSPRSNKRTDGYGGDLKGRMRFAVECSAHVRRQVKDSFLISYRMSGEEFVPGGVTLAESAQLAKNLELAGINIIHVSAGVADDGKFLVTPDLHQPQGVFADLAHKIKKAVSIPVISVGKIHTQEIAEEILRKEKADCIAIGRALIADPFWPLKVYKNRTDEIIKCKTCNQCIKTISKGEKLVCAVNPNAGNEKLS